MKTNQICLFFALLLTFQLSAQGDYTAYDLFEEGTVCYLLADAVNMRSKADAKAKLIAKIPIGTEVKILKQSEERLTLYGFEAPWYKVIFYDNGTAKSGYIWGGFIALPFKGASKNDKGVQFLYGISKVIPRKDSHWSSDSIVMQVRVCKDNIELQKIEFGTSNAISAERTGELHNAKGVKGIENILELEDSEGSCGVISVATIFFWDAKKLHLVQTTANAYVSSCFDTEVFIYPKEEGGKSGLILKKKESGCDEEEEEKPDSSKTKYEFRIMEEYIWENDKLTLLKKYDIK